MNFSFDTIITILIIGSIAFSFFSNASKVTRETQRRAKEQDELNRQTAELARKRREGDPNTQSMQSYLDRTRPERLEDAQDDFRQPERAGAVRPGTFGADLEQSGQLSEQERLRREMARKMGRTPSGSPSASTAPSRGQAQSLEGLLREFTQAVEGRQAQPSAPARPAPRQASSRPPSRPSAQIPRPVSTTIESTIRPSMQSNVGLPGTLATQASVVNVSAAAAERAMAAERESQGASVVSKGSQTRSWESATTGDIVRAIIWTEILNPPKSRRR